MTSRIAMAIRTATGNGTIRVMTIMGMDRIMTARSTGVSTAAGAATSKPVAVAKNEKGPSRVLFLVARG